MEISAAQWATRLYLTCCTVLHGERWFIVVVEEGVVHHGRGGKWFIVVLVEGVVHRGASTTLRRSLTVWN